MGVILGGVILALALRGVTLGVGQAECHGGAGCDVTWVLGQSARVECSADIYRPTRQPDSDGSGSETTAKGDATDFFENSNNTLEDFEFDNESSNDTLSDHFNSSRINVTSESEINRTTSDAMSETYNKYGFDITLKDSLSGLHTDVEHITKVELFLSDNTTQLDLALFPNLRTVIINTSGYVFPKVCNTKNITEISATSSKLRDVTFVRYFFNATSLNLSYNFIRSFPDKELPPNLVSLDLSYNNIILYTNISLQDSLQNLNISYNNITSVEPVVIRGNVIVLDLRANRLQCVPSFSTIKLEELYLSKNNISELLNQDFRFLGSLGVLDLSGNKLGHLEARVFQGLGKLQKLDLSENTIVSFDPSNFQYLNNLVVLKLSKNTHLGSLQDAEDPSLLFGPGQRLQVIDASAISLSRLPSTLTRSVKTLLLSDNIIHTIQCGELDSFPLLQEMDLSNNEVTEIEEDALGRLDFLSYLYLAGNNLTSIPKSLPDQLEVLDLRCNFIQQLKNYEFLGMQKLRVLLLSRNLIGTVEDGAFGQLTALEVLDLSHNPIKTLSRTSLLGPRRLKEIYLVSLTELIPLAEPLSFPAPESAHLEVLNVESSPVLASQLMDDVAALTMFHELFELNMNHCRLSTLRNDLPKYLPRLHKLELTGNHLNCTNIMWLVKWLQALNISMQDKGKFRQEMYHLNDICCGKVNEAEHQEEQVMCASPENLSGKQIIALKEEDFPDLKLMSPTHPPRRQLVVTEPYLTTLPSSSRNMSQSQMAESLADTTLSINNSDEVSSQPLSVSSFRNKLDTTQTNWYETKPYPTRTSFSNNYYSLERPPMRSAKVKLGKSINRSTQKWKYLKSETKYKPSSTLDPVVVLLNDTKTRYFDNQLNESSGGRAQFLAHELPPTSHPGMVVFLLIVGVILGASSAMVYSQYVQARRGREYQHHQDIEVSSFGGTDLW